MSIKTQTNRTPGSRHQINIEKNILCKYNGILKQLRVIRKKNSGRNFSGKICVRHKGADVKKKQNLISYNNKTRFRCVVLAVCYDSNRNTFINLNFDLETKVFFNTLSLKGIYPGALIEKGYRLKEFKLGFISSLEKLPIGSIISSVNRNFHICFAKSAGSFCQIVEKKKRIVKIKLPSGKIIFVYSNDFAALGKNNNLDYSRIVVGKAGRNRLKGIRPSVRGIAMNPVDHPHGGKSNKGKPPVTPWGLPTKNYPTVKKYKI
jgi:large subunit ribosomal protein L2